MPAPVSTPLVVVLVGTDHHPFDRLVGWSATLAAEGWASWFVQHGATGWPAHAPSTLTGSPMLADTELRQLIDTADCVVTHAGPGLLMDAAAAGHRPVVVPRDPAHGEHVDAHQLRFAARMAETGRVRIARDVGELRYAVQQALRSRRTGAVPDGPGAVCDRLSALVTDTLARRRLVRSS
ncbi:glycosyltransferase [Nocardioides daejeonensis]|uniref:glycosyltransferase n=1 Tax=Nocardioides daejeonensis TaxID=1046556 RepID=UPI000D74982B|nr:glycosyltransferase [Nocardioides daejeonensis]